MKIRYHLKRLLRKSYYIILGFLSMFLFTFNVNGLTYTTTDSSLPSYIDINGVALGLVYFSSGRFTSSGSGYLLFSFAVGSATNGNVDGITEVIVYKKSSSNSSGVPYVCDIGNGTWYTDNQQQRIIYSVKCPMDLNNNEYLSHLGFFRGSSAGRIFVYLPNFFSYTAEVSDANSIINSNNQNIQQQIQNDNTNTQSLMNGMAYVNNTIIEQGNREHQDHQEMMDYNQNNIQQPDNTNSSDFQSGVDDILNNFDNINYNDVFIPKDNASNNWVWNTMFALFGTHGLITATFIGILSIGVLKQVLGR